MKLAEVLIQRSGIKQKLGELNTRIEKNTMTQGGDQPTEDPLELVENFITFVDEIET